MKTKEIKSGPSRTGARLAPYRRALERVGAALAKNAGSKLSAREKIDRLQRRLFGDAAVDAVNESERRAQQNRMMEEETSYV